MSIQTIDYLPHMQDKDTEDGLQEIDMNSSREATARLDLIISRSWHDLWNAPEDDYHTLLLSNGASCSVAPGVHLVEEADGKMMP